MVELASVFGEWVEHPDVQRVGSLVAKGAKRALITLVAAVALRALVSIGLSYAWFGFSAGVVAAPLLLEYGDRFASGGVSSIAETCREAIHGQHEEFYFHMRWVSMLVATVSGLFFPTLAYGVGISVGLAVSFGLRPDLETT